MSESEPRHNDSPLQTERGSTTISDTVVSSIAGMAAQEVEGVHMGGGASRTAGGVLGSITGSESQTRGVSVEVGRTETAIDLKMGVEYGRNILQSVEEVRRRITDRVQSMTGLRVAELNATITDVTFPEKEERRRLGSGSGTREAGGGAADESRSTEPETTKVDPRSRAGVDEPEEIRGEHSSPEIDETAELRPEDAGIGERGTDEATETPAEQRRRRRAEERARRRRRTEES